MNNKIPYEIITIRKSSLKYFRHFGCLCYVLDPLSKGKLDERGIENFLIGCEDTNYAVIDPHTGKVRRSKHASFIESKVYRDVYGEKKKQTVLIEGQQGEVDEQSFMRVNLTQKNVENVWCHLASLLDDTENWSELYALAGDVVDEPRSFSEAVNSNERDDWLKAVNEEMKSQIKNGTWEYVKRTEVPKKFRIMSSRWVFKKKENMNGENVFKARLVIRGFSDRNWYDLTETYAPVARLTDVRFILSLSNKLDLELHQLDVKTAFLNGELEKEVYMEIP